MTVFDYRVWKNAGEINRDNSYPTTTSMIATGSIGRIEEDMVLDKQSS